MGGENPDVARRSYGTGSLIARTDSTGRETWHAKVRAGRRQVWRKLGEKRAPGARDGLTRTQAEARVRKLIEELERTPVVVERLTVEDIGRRYLKHLRTLGRRRSTLLDYESYLRVHLVPFFGDLPLEKIGRADVEDFIAEKLGDGKAAKSVRNYLVCCTPCSPTPRSRSGRAATRASSSRSRATTMATPTSAFSPTRSSRRCCAGPRTQA